MTKSGAFFLTAGVVLALAGASWFYLDNFKEVNEPSDIGQPIEAGVALFNQKKYAEAVEVFENVPAGHPQEWYSLYYLGSTYIMLKDYQAAVEHLEPAFSLNPTETRIMHALGVAYFKLGNLKLSKAYFAAVLDINPDDDEARGLMDIMANLERQQPGADQETAPADPESKDKGH